MRFVSHRGAAGIAHENSLAALEAGHAYRPDFIEVDIHRTRDGVFVMYHGDLRKTYAGTVLDETYDGLKARIPTLLTLREFCQKAPRAAYLFDIKVRTANDELLNEFRKVPRKLIGGFTSPHPLSLAALKELYPDVDYLISQPYTEGPMRPIELARKYGFTGISLNKWWLGPFVYRFCKVNRLKIMVYTVDSKLTMRLIMRFFGDVYLCTNHPERLAQLIEEHGTLAGATTN